MAYKILRISFWGGEPAAAILTEQQQPKIFYLYSNTNWKIVAEKIKANTGYEVGN